MGRTARDKRGGEPKPVQKIEVSDKNVKLRVILLIITIIVGAVGLGFGVRSCVSKESGWTVISPSVKGFNVAGDFVLSYELGRGGVSATAENRALNNLYGGLCQKAYNLFESSAEGGELEKINSSAGEYVEIDGATYSALKLAAEKGGKILYTAPYYERLRSLFNCSNDYEASIADPYREEGLKALFSKLSGFIEGSAATLDFGEDNKVKLTLSEEYKTFAEENGIKNFVGFTWLRNAFIVDYMSKQLVENGFTAGIISSRDGFSAALDRSKTEYAQNVYGRIDGKPTLMCTVKFSGPRNGVFIKNFPIKADADNYYVYGSGDIVAPYVDTSGQGKSAADCIYLYGGEKSVAELALLCADLYVADVVDEVKLKSYETEGIYGLYAKNGGIRHTEESPVFCDLYTSGEKTVHTKRIQ